MKCGRKKEIDMKQLIELLIFYRMNSETILNRKYKINVSEISRELGITRQTIYNYIKPLSVFELNSIINESYNTNEIMKLIENRKLELSNIYSNDKIEKEDNEIKKNTNNKTQIKKKKDLTFFIN